MQRWRRHLLPGRPGGGNCRSGHRPLLWSVRRGVCLHGPGVWRVRREDTRHRLGVRVCIRHLWRICGLARRLVAHAQLCLQCQRRGALLGRIPRRLPSWAALLPISRSQDEVANKDEAQLAAIRSRVIYVFAIIDCYCSHMHRRTGDRREGIVQIQQCYDGSQSCHVGICCVCWFGKWNC